MNKNILYFFILSFLLCSCNKNKEPKPDSSGTFMKFFGGAFDDHGFSVVSSGDGGYYLAGSTRLPGRPDTNLYIVKIDRNGNKIWDRKYNLNDNYDEVAKDIIVNKNGSILVAGYKKSKRDQSDFLLFKINSNNPDDTKIYLFGDSTNNEKATSIFQDNDGAFILLGSKATTETSLNYYFFKTDLVDTLWYKDIGVFAQDDIIGKLKRNKLGNLVWCGTTKSHDGYDITLTSADSYGNILWSRLFEGNDGKDQIGFDMDNWSDGYVVVGSQAKTDDERSIYVVRTDQKGFKTKYVDRFNDLTINNNASQEIYSVISLPNDQYAMTGYITNSKGNKDVYVLKIDGKGNIINSNTFGGDDDDTGMKIIQTNDNGFFVIGSIYASNNSMIGVYKLNEQLKLIK